MMIKILILTLTINTPILATCDYTTLEEAAVTAQVDNGNSLGPTRDQDGVGWCYAYATADLMEHWLKKKEAIPLDQNVSAVSVALMDQKVPFSLYNQQFQTNSFSAAGIEDPVAWAQKEKDKISNELDKIWEPLDASNDEAMNEYRALRTNEVSPLLTKISTLDEQIETSPENVAELSQERDQANSLLSLKKEQLRTLIRETRENHIIENFYNSQPEVLERFELLTNQLTYYRFLSTPGSESDFPQGGRIETAIDSSWPNICFESEVSSRDEELINQMGKHASFTEAIDTMIDARFNTTACVECDALKYAETIFPGVGNLDELVDIVINLAPHEDGFSQLMAKACSNKNLSLHEKPTLRNIDVNKNIPIELERSAKILSAIDSALSSGKIATIGYHGYLLYQEDFPTPGNEYQNDSHASVITGSMDICGEKYYKLRNSWGSTACTSIQSRLIDKKGNSENLPYLCDNDGNFIIKQAHLQKGLYGTTHIEN